MKSALVVACVMGAIILALIWSKSELQVENYSLKNRVKLLEYERSQEFAGWDEKDSVCRIYTADGLEYPK